VITLDGPAGAGKGTVALALARRLGWHYLDSGALYRTLALAAARHGLATDDEAALVALAARLPVDFRCAPEGVTVLLDGAPLGPELRGEACSALASRIAALPGVRRALHGLQLAFLRPPGLVADGRDMGTVVFPGAVLKLFLTAAAGERARRRRRQLQTLGICGKLEEIMHAAERRDQQDRGRQVAPLRPAADAVVLDTTTLRVDEVLAQVFDLARTRAVAVPVAGQGAASELRDT